MQISKATNNWGAVNTFAPLTVRVTSINGTIVSNRPANDMIRVSNAESFKFFPDPVGKYFKH